MQTDQDDDRFARRTALAAEVGARLGIDEAALGRLVETFYARAREDDLLGPVFAVHVENWPSHEAKVQAFWSSVMLLSGRYRGQPMVAHARLDVDARHFDRWLALFEATAREMLAPVGADALVERAKRIAQSLELGIATARGTVLAPGRRLDPP
ncbi:MAG: group III truncated hemoglobin [Hyphomicrobiales bacterium]|nr:group III truncated hemoglobin [Hyphomicrobiales bacterium]MDE2016534.1 group III truncated hemoglobin [Hyphomicrobiales bacterium]